MFNEGRRRFYIALSTLIAFVIIIVLLVVLTPRKMMTDYYQAVEDAVVNEEWSVAKDNINTLEESYKRNKFIISLASVPKDVDEFEKSLGKVKFMINREEDSAVDYLSDLRKDLSSVLRFFPVE